MRRERIRMGIERRGKKKGKGKEEKRKKKGRVSEGVSKSRRVKEKEDIIEIKKARPDVAEHKYRMSLGLFVISDLDI